jgi:DNA-binding protein HU-beta
VILEFALIAALKIDKSRSDSLTKLLRCGNSNNRNEFRARAFLTLRGELLIMTPLFKLAQGCSIAAYKRRGNVIKLDIVNQVADKTGVPKTKAEVAVEALFEAMKNALQRGERIELRGFGVFVVKPRKRGVGRNPRTGEVTDIPPGKTIRFKPGKELQA